MIWAYGIDPNTDINGTLFDGSSSDWMNMWATEDAFFTANQHNYTQSTNWTFFGKYVPIEGLSPEMPYFQWSYRGRTSNISINSSLDDFWSDLGGMHHVGSPFGGEGDGSGSSGAVWYGCSNGGLAAALTASTSTVRKFMVGVSSIAGGIDAMDTNFGESSGSLVFDELPFYLFANEAPYTTGSIGYVGTSGDLKVIRFAGHSAVTPLGSKIALKSPPSWGGDVDRSYASPYIVMPWTGSVKPFYDMRKEGTDFYIP
jgi:hypothetical protein